MAFATKYHQKPAEIHVQLQSLSWHTLEGIEKLQDLAEKMQRTHQRQYNVYITYSHF